MLGVAPAQLSRPPATPPLQYSPQLVVEIKKVQQAALESDYAYRQLAHLSNNIGPRLSGSPQAQAAVEYVAAELRKLGLDVKLEKVMVPHWVRGEETAALTDYPSMAPNTTQKIVLTALGGSVPTPADGLVAEVVVVNNFDELQALGACVQRECQAECAAQHCRECALAKCPAEAGTCLSQTCAP